MVTALEDLQIRAAGECGFDADADFARFEGGWRDVFNPDFFPAVQDGGFHAGSLQAWMNWRKKVLRILLQQCPDSVPDKTGCRFQQDGFKQQPPCLCDITAFNQRISLAAGGKNQIHFVSKQTAGFGVIFKRIALRRDSGNWPVGTDPVNMDFRKRIRIVSFHGCFESLIGLACVEPDPRR